MRICPACKFENVDNAKFCEKCGVKLEGNTQNLIQQNQVQEVTAKKEKKSKNKRFTKLQKVIIAEVIGVGIAIVLFFLIGNMKYSAENIAEKYFEAYMAHDWHTMYSLLELPEGSFMKETQFAELMEKEAVPELSNYVINSKNNSEASMTQEFEVKYSASDKGAATMDITLSCDGSKEVLFFDKWRVSSAGILVNDYPISVPSGAKVAVDGVALTEPSSREYGVDTYTLSIFNGIHELSVAMPWCDLYKEQIDTTTSESTNIDITEISLTPEGEKALQAKAQKDLKKWFSAGISGADYSKVNDLFSQDVVDEYEKPYHKLVIALEKDPNSDYWVNGLNFFNLEFELDSDEEENVRKVKVTYEYTTSYTYKNVSKTTSYTTDAVMDVSYICEDGTWKIQSLSIE